MVDYSREAGLIYFEATKMLDGDDMPLQYGPAHIVWGDCNMEDVHIDGCIEDIKDGRLMGVRDYYKIAVIFWSLQKLKELSEDGRVVWGDAE